MENNGASVQRWIFSICSTSACGGDWYSSTAPFAVSGTGAFAAILELKVCFRKRFGETKCINLDAKRTNFFMNAATPRLLGLGSAV